MKITVDSKSFIDAVLWSLKSFDGRDDKAFVALKVTEEGVGSVYHSNATSYLKSGVTILAAELDSTHEVVIPMQGQFIQRLAGSLDPSGPSELVYKDETLVLTNKLGKFTIPTFKSKVTSPPEFEKLGEVENAIFFDALQRLAKLCDLDSAGLYPTLGTVDLMLDFDGAEAKLMATDRYTLGEVVVDFQPEADAEKHLDGKSNILIPHAAAVLVAPSKGDITTTDIVFEPSSGKFGYSFTDGRVALFALQEADPIPYAPIKVNALENIEHSVQLQTRDLQKAIGTIANLAWDEVDIFLKVDADGLKIHDESNSNRVEIELTDNEVEEEQDIKFNRSVVGKIFAPIGTAKMNVRWGSTTGAFVFEAVLDDGTVADNIFVLAVPSS